MTPLPLPRRKGSAPGRPSSLAVAVALLMAVALLAATGQQDPLAVGSDLPDFELESLDGDTHRPASVADGTALIVVFFRGAW